MDKIIDTKYLFKVTVYYVPTGTEAIRFYATNTMQNVIDHYYNYGNMYIRCIEYIGNVSIFDK